MSISWIRTHKLLSIVIFFLFFIACTISVNSYIASWFLKSWLQEQAVDVELQDLTLSFRKSELQIKGLSTKGLKGKQLNIGSLKVNWLWSDLWSKQISITQLALDDIRLDIVGNNFKPESIGPIVLENLAATDSEQPQTNSSWIINLGESKLSNLLACYQDKEVDYASLQLPLSNSLATVDICVDWNHLDLNTSLNINTDKSFSFAGNIELSNFNLVEQSQNKLLSLKGASIDNLLVDEKIVSLEEITLNKLNLLAQNLEDTFADKGASIEQIQLEKMSWEAISKITTFDSFATQNLRLNLRASDKKIHQGLSMDFLNVNKVNVNDQNVSIGSLIIDNISVLKRIIESDKASKIPDHLIDLKKVSLNNIDVTPDQLELQSLALEGLNSWLIIDQYGINIDRWLAKPKEASDNSAHSSKSFNISIENISLNNDSSVTLIDNLNSEAIPHEVNNIIFNVKNFHHGESTGQPSYLNYSLDLKNSGSIAGKGFFQSLDKNIELELVGKLSHIDLVKFTHLSEKLIGYRVDQGLLNVDYDVKIKDNIIDSDFGIFLEKFELANLQEHEQTPTNEALGIPLPLALNLLRDSDDNISIDIPLSGDVTAPDFSLASIFTTVSVKAIKNAVIHYYSPLGMLSLASGIIDLATALRFDPLIFEKHSTVLSTTAKQQLDKVTKIMNDKPNIKFVICAQATILDALSDEAKVDHKPLIELANQRQKMVVDYILLNESIQASRIVGCNVKLSSDPKALVKVDVSI